MGSTSNGVIQRRHQEKKTVVNTGEDTEATLDQLMGEFNLGGCSGRKRNWDRNAKNLQSEKIPKNWSRSTKPPWVKDNENIYVEDPYKTIIDGSSHRKDNTTRDVGFWTNVFFSKSPEFQLDSPTSIHSPSTATSVHRSNNVPKSGSGEKLKKKSTTSIIIGHLLNDSESCLNSEHHLYDYTNDLDDSPRGFNSTDSLLSRYTANNENKRKTNLMPKSKISSNLNASSLCHNESERLARTDLFLLPTGNTNRRIYADLNDCNPNMDVNQFRQVDYFDFSLF